MYPYAFTWTNHILLNYVGAENIGIFYYQHCAVLHVNAGSRQIKNNSIMYYVVLVVVFVVLGLVFVFLCCICVVFGWVFALSSAWETSLRKHNQ